MTDPKKKDELDEVLGVSSNPESEHKLEDIDPLFAEKEERWWLISLNSCRRW